MVGAGAWRMLRIGGLILSGYLQVRYRFPSLGADAQAQHAQRWAGQVLRVLRIESQRVGSPADGVGAGLLLVANHVSWLDVVVLLHACPHARFVAKSDVRRWPLVGALVAQAGSLFIDRSKRHAVVQALDDMAGRLRAGATLVVFPEGTTSDGRQVLPFHASLLQAAQRAGSAVQPVALRYRERGHAVSLRVPYIGDDSFIGNLWRLCAAEGVTAHLQWLPALDAASQDRRALAGALRSAIAATLEGSPA